VRGLFNYAQSKAERERGRDGDAERQGGVERTSAIISCCLPIGPIPGKGRSPPPAHLPPHLRRHLRRSIDTLRSHRSLSLCGTTRPGKNHSRITATPLPRQIVVSNYQIMIWGRAKEVAAIPGTQPSTVGIMYILTV